MLMVDYNENIHYDKKKNKYQDWKNIIIFPFHSIKNLLL